MSNVLSGFMGAAFNHLAPLLQKIHSGSARLEGIVEIRRGNWLAKIICNLFGFPKQNPACMLSVDCSHSNDQMFWLRRFDGLEMKSNFTLRGKFLVERLGPLDLYLSPQEEQGTLSYRFVGARLLGIPIPGFLSPKISARESEQNGVYQFQVTVTMFIIGLVIAYGGQLQLMEG